MKLNLDKLKNKLSHLKGENKGNKEKKVSRFWSPKEVGEHKVYLLPIPGQEDYPFVERQFYFNLNKGKDERGWYKKPPLTNKQFSEEDPVADMANELWNSEDNEDKELAKVLFPGQTVYIPVIVEGEEELGPRWWRFSSKSVYTALTKMFVEKDTYSNKGEYSGIMTDPENGIWIEITVDTVPKKKPPFNKKISDVRPAMATIVERQPLDKELYENAMEDLASEDYQIDNLLKWQKHSAEELQKMLKEWADAGDPSEEELEDEGTERGFDDSEEEEEEKPKKKKAPKKKATKTKEEMLQEMKEFEDDDD